jgi:hypothetical protein
MNKIVAFGIAALSASSIEVVLAQPLSSPPSKPWSVSATLRGFYDDNVNTAGSSAAKTDTFGVEISPALGLNWMNDATTVSLGYRYALKYYDDKPAGSEDSTDQTHTFDAKLEHVINERFRITASDAFVIGQEPDALRVGSFSTVQRIDGDNLRNYARVILNAAITPIIATELGYANEYYNYDDPVNSAQLDRVEHRIHTEGHFQVLPQTRGIIGYQYGQIDYTYNSVSEMNNSRSHYVYLGASQNFRPDLNGSLRAGVQTIDFYNDPTADDHASPYVQAAANYTYAPESYVQAGFTQSRRPTQEVANDADTSVLFGSIHHRIIPRLYGSVIGTFQHSVFNGGLNDGESEQYFQLGLNLMYRLNAFLSAEVGYNYDKVNSDIANRGYDRNRVYMGVTASY